MCNCKFVPMMMCCNCGGNNNVGGGGSTGFKETVLYDNVINAIGSYTLTDNINNYDDIFVVHEYQENEKQRQCFIMPVSALCDMQMVCHGNSSLSAYANFNFTGDKINVTIVVNSYRIVKIIGRKY